MNERDRLAWRVVAAAGLSLSAAGLVRAGGGAENAIILVDPGNRESMFLGNYYKSVRNIPDQNILYMDPDASDYTAFRTVNLPGLLGHLNQASLGDHIDYVIVTPGNNFYVNAPGLVDDGCFSINRFSISSAYTMAYIVNDIIPPANPAQSLPNRYYSSNNTVLAFDSNQTYFGGSGSTSSSARRYFIGAMLGFIGANGNPVTEVQQLIDRSAAADGTRPAGTFYFMDNTADVARNVRASQFNAVISFLTGNGSLAERIVGTLPVGRHDILGCMSGFANQDIVGANMTIVPGAFADHLTSWAAMFDNGSQTECSEWIRKGGSGSAGTVEEPCNYPGKFPHARFHSYYSQGTTLGEAYLRSALYTPFQGLLYGDPLTRPFAHIPTVNSGGPLGGTVSGTINLTPTGSNSKPGTTVNNFELHIDGVLHSTVGEGGVFTVDTTQLPDGFHSVRILGTDSSSNRAQGRLVSFFTSSNFGRSATLNVPTTSGNLATAYTFDVSSSGGAVQEVRILANGRVVAARAGDGSMTVRGQSLGAGFVRTIAETVYADGRTCRSLPVTINISLVDGTPSGTAPGSFSYSKRVRNDSAVVVELPSSLDVHPATATFTVVSGPTKGTIIGGTHAYRIVQPDAGATGTDTIVYRVTTGAGSSGDATVTLVYSVESCPADFNGDGFVSGDDFDAYVAAFEAGSASADFNGDGFVSGDDFDAFVVAFEAGC